MKRRLCLLAFGMLLAGLTLGGGTGCSDPETGDNDTVTRGKSLLAEGNSEEARDVFSAELYDDPDSCNGLYGRALADFQSLLKLTDDLLAAGAGFMAAGFGPKMVVDAYPYLESLLEPFQKILIEMEEDTDRLIELDCTFHTDSYQLVLKTDEQTPIIELALSGEWNQVEALLAGGQIHMLLGLIDYISAHNLMVDLESLLGMIPSGSFPSKQFISQARFVGEFFQDNSYFLTKSENRWELMTKARQEWIEGLSEDAAVLDAIENAKGDPDSAIFGFTDVNNDGFGAGDEMSLGIDRLSVSGGSTLLGRVRFSVPDYLSRELVLHLKGLLDKARTALEAVDSGGASERIGLADLNPVFTAFSGEIAAAVSSIQIKPLPDVIQLDLQAFFSEPKPLRDFLPVIQEVRSGVYEFMIEGEVVTDGNSNPDMAEGATISVGDSTHFPDGYLIPADCLTAEIGGVLNPIPYIAFPDSTFNGLLWINLDPIDDNVGSCPADPAGYLPADRYSLSKLIAALLVGYAQVPQFQISF